MGAIKKAEKSPLSGLNHLKSQNLLVKSLTFARVIFQINVLSLRIIGPLNGGVCTSVGGRVLKIATFGGSGFLGLYFSTNVKTFLGQDRFRLQGSDSYYDSC